MGAFGHSQFPAFTTQLPAESQGLLGSTLDASDPLTTMMMAGGQPGNFWNFTGQGILAPAGIGGHSYNAEKLQQQQQYAPSLAGLNSTLAPAELSRENTKITSAPVEKPSTKIEDLTLLDDLGDEDANNNPDFFENAMMGKDGVTPGLNGDSWDSWINDGSWDVAPTSSQ